MKRNPYDYDQRPLRVQWKRSIAREAVVKSALYSLGSPPFLALMYWVLWKGAG